MYRVNLLPENYLKNARNQAIKNRIIYGSILVLAALFVLYRVLVSYGVRTYDRYSSLAQDNQRLVKLISQLKDPDSPRADATEINSIIERIAGSGKDFGKLLVLISNSSPDDVAISRFSVSYGETGAVCVLYATASSYDTVSTWIDVLSGYDDFGEITPSYISAEGEGIEGRVEFELRIPVI
jgi:hypothetical protein